jgi:hypothetical protein
MMQYFMKIVQKKEKYEKNTLNKNRKIRKIKTKP